MTDTNAAPNRDAIVGFVTHQTEIKRSLLQDLLCTAVEGGSGYWAMFDEIERTPDLDYLSVRVAEQEVSSGAKRRRMVIKAEQLLIGLQRLADAATANKFPSAYTHLHDALMEEGDAITADVVLQMTLFGELVYG